MTETSDDRPSAAALRWDGRDAPRVVAKGDDEVARRILDIARANHVPIVEDAGLCSLLSKVDLGEEIPEALFFVVATVLAYIYKVHNKLPPNRLQPNQETAGGFE